MGNEESTFREEIRALEVKNSVPESHVAHFEKMQRSFSDNLEVMKAGLDNFQLHLEKCRANLLIVPRSPEEQSTTSSAPEENGNHQPQTLNVAVALKSEIELLKAQLEIYKNDFAQERMARQALLVEKNQLGGELQQLQQQNRNLLVDALNGQAELQELNYSRRCSRMSEESDRAAKQAEQFDEHVERRASHCAHCNRDFGDIQSLETHIDECPAY